MPHNGSVSTRAGGWGVTLTPCKTGQGKPLSRPSSGFPHREAEPPHSQVYIIVAPLHYALPMVRCPKPSPQSPFILTTVR